MPYRVGLASCREVTGGQIPGGTAGRLKLIFYPETREILGVDILGEGASGIVQIGRPILTPVGTID